MKYIVLGMHKSGTTLITKILHESGIFMGPFKEKGDYYKGEDCERLDIFHVISDMLSSHNLHSLDTTPPFGEDKIKENVKRIAEIVQESDSQFENWGFKNPRTAFVYDYIKKILGEHKLICIYRDLKNVVSHYTRSKFFNIVKAITAWKEYNKKMIAILNNSNSDCIVLKFEKLLEEDREFKRFEDFVGIKLKDTRIKGKRKNTSIIKNKIGNFIVNIMMKYNLLEVRSITDELASFIKNEK